MSNQPQAPQQAEADPRSGDDLRAGFCAILGLPNAGKSTLLNTVLGRRLVAVSRKPQTTRNRILGVHNVELPAREDAPAQPVQIIFVDTPGIQHGPGALRRYMRDQALGAAGDADVALLLVDLADPGQRDPARFRARDTEALLSTLSGGKAPVLVALNKVDTVRDKDALLPVIAAYAEAGLGDEIVPLSAKSGDGVGRLVDAIGRRLPVGPRLFPEDMITDRAERFLAAELVREQLFRQLGQELPYATAVTVESFQERAGRGDIVMGAVIYVERDSQKGIVVGKGGQRIKEVGQRAREAISQLFGCPVHVKLHVKVADNWSRGERGIRDMGYE
ncbi:GTPase Era [Haliangium sp.]|uniref:GTPase Era n=1 Tax=Haliangium sp. TaxID=2663208 RepID=UPI003D0AF455